MHLGLSGLTANTVQNITTLPEGYRPDSWISGYGLSNSISSTCSLQINSSGVVSVRPSSTYALIDIEFDAVQ